MTMINDPLAAAAPPLAAPTGRGWAVAGLISGAAGLVSIVSSSLADAVYDASVAGDAPGIVDTLADQVPQILVVHTAAMISALLLLVFAPGLRRFIAARVPPGSLLPD